MATRPSGTTTRTTRARRQPVEVDDGEAVVGIDAQLAEGGSISGRVTDESGDPLAGVTVHWRGGTTNAQPPRPMARTRSAGWRAYSYTVQFQDFQDRGYLSEWFDDAPDQASATPVVVGGGQAVSGIDAQLADGWFDQRQGHRSVWRPASRISASRLGELSSQSAFTEDDGSYQIRGLVAGSYTVGFEENQGRGYRSEWFDDAPDDASATPVVVAEGEAVSGIDAQLTHPRVDQRHRDRRQRRSGGWCGGDSRRTVVRSRRDVGGRFVPRSAGWWRVRTT